MSVAAQLVTIPGVAGLSAGRFGEVALLYPRHRVEGLSLKGSTVSIHLVLDLTAGRAVREIAEDVRRLTAAALPGLTIDVYFSDAQESS
ncbi:hypothetical protein CATRI_01960 [Corynebacterium atrinae]|nr:hypothetical protein CATRI_01960 [Corynebacterium atrinae]